jgi:hypothetical protein
MWQPIETAPKDGTPILVADAKSVEVGVWQEETEDDTECGVVTIPGFDAGWWGSEWQPGGKQPTHWMPMPDPPAALATPDTLPPVAVGDVVIERTFPNDGVRVTDEDQAQSCNVNAQSLLALYRTPLWQRWKE